MEIAIMGSTIEGGIFTICSAPKKIVKVCARVNDDICQISALNLTDNKNNPTTNKMWSKPFGTIC